LPHQATLLPIGDPFIELPTVDSTNNYAIAQLQKGTARHGTAFYAYSQTEGRGQRGKTWTTNPGENLILTVVLQPDALKPSECFYLSAAIAAACYDFFKSYAGSDTSIKWPNDVYWRDRKAGGILIENIIKKGFLDSAIVGIGININQTKFAEDLSNPVSLKQITGNTYNPVELAKKLCSYLDSYYKKLGKDRHEILQYYNRNLYKRNQMVTLKKKSTLFNTTLQEVSAAGRLITMDTIKREFDSGEVEWVI
jgi:BirA family transcriptional regulator, biotin operon repressor / biotin---[acetyl-CoA-carboxylase] ligase